LKSVLPRVATTRSYSSSINGTFTEDSAAFTVFECRVLEESSGRLVAQISGPGAMERFAPESGGHRWQRIPPTERNGRRQSSTVTVAILGQTARSTFDIRDVEFRYCVASVGAGGQNRQKNMTACLATHRPTGITAKCESERSRKTNRQKALRELEKRVRHAHDDRQQAAENGSRSNQIGSGERGDKIRTVQVCHGVVTNHLTGKKIALRTYLKGNVADIQ
jgi:peptide chain release factor 1